MRKAIVLKTKDDLDLALQSLVSWKDQASKKVYSVKHDCYFCWKKPYCIGCPVRDRTADYDARDVCCCSELQDWEDAKSIKEKQEKAQVIVNILKQSIQDFLETKNENTN